MEGGGIFYSKFGNNAVTKEGGYLAIIDINTKKYVVYLIMNIVYTLFSWWFNSWNMNQIGNIVNNGVFEGVQT